MGLRMDDLHAPMVASGPNSQATPNGAEELQSLQQLISQKENLEAELSALGSVLNSHGVNMNTPLTTFDGFPRSDIDVPQIRTTRARIIRLKNDHKAVMFKMEVAVHEQFAKAEDSSANGTSRMQEDPSTATSATSSSSVLESPFAKVNTVVPNSPADLAGLRVGDKVVRFGIANFTNHERLSKVAQVVQQNENRPVPVKILREAPGNAASTSIELRLTPRKDWGGRGLLGCHLLPL